MAGEYEDEDEVDFKLINELLLILTPFGLEEFT
jgi:hypothetical protein